jgi:hypothetical protein
MASNLPPGVSDSDIPGNRPEDQEWDNLWDWLGDKDIEPNELRMMVEDYLRRKEVGNRVPRFMVSLFTQAFNNMASIVHETAVEKGWWQCERNNGVNTNLLNISSDCEVVRGGNWSCL